MKENISEIEKDKKSTRCELLDYIDINTLRKILEAFTNCTDFMANIVDLSGKSLFSRKDISKCSRFCKQIYSYDGGIERCQSAYCRAGVQAAKFREPYIFRCPAGLVEWAAPVMIGDRHIATIICGQVLMWEPEEFFWLELKEMNSSLTSEYDQLFEAARELPVVSGEKVRSALEILYIISNYIVNFKGKVDPDELMVRNPVASNEDNYSEKTKICIEYFKEHLGEKIDVKTIAENVGFSISAVSKTFKDDTNRSLMEYLTDLRIERACELLVSNKYHIGEISHALGFEDQNYFSRVFKKEKGISPTEYRNNYCREV